MLLLWSLSSWILPKMFIEMVNIMLVKCIKVSMIRCHAMLCDVLVTSMMGGPVKLIEIVVGGRCMVSVVSDVLHLVSVRVSVICIMVVVVPPDRVVVTGLILEILWVLDEIVVDKLLMIEWLTHVLNQFMLENQKLCDRHCYTNYKLL